MVDLEEYRPGANLARVFGHCLVQNAEETADTDSCWLQDF